MSEANEKKDFFKEGTLSCFGAISVMLGGILIINSNDAIALLGFGICLIAGTLLTVLEKSLRDKCDKSETDRKKTLEQKEILGRAIRRFAGMVFENHWEREIRGKYLSLSSSEYKSDYEFVNECRDLYRKVLELEKDRAQLLETRGELLEGLLADMLILNKEMYETGSIKPNADEVKAIRAVAAKTRKKAAELFLRIAKYSRLEANTLATAMVMHGESAALKDTVVDQMTWLNECEPNNARRIIQDFVFGHSPDIKPISINPHKET